MANKAELPLAQGAAWGSVRPVFPAALIVLVRHVRILCVQHGSESASHIGAVRHRHRSHCQIVANKSTERRMFLAGRFPAAAEPLVIALQAPRADLAHRNDEPAIWLILCSALFRNRGCRNRLLRLAPSLRR